MLCGPDAALQHVADTEVTADAGGIRPRRDAPRGLPPEDGDLLEAGELAQDLLGQAVGVDLGRPEARPGP